MVLSFRRGRDSAKKETGWLTLAWGLERTRALSALSSVLRVMTSQEWKKICCDPGHLDRDVAVIPPYGKISQCLVLLKPS